MKSWFRYLRDREAYLHLNFILGIYAICFVALLLGVSPCWESYFMTRGVLPALNITIITHCFKGDIYSNLIHELMGLHHECINYAGFGFFYITFNTCNCLLQISTLKSSCQEALEGLKHWMIPEKVM